MPGLDERRKGGVTLWQRKPASKREKKCIEETRERLTKEVDAAHQTEKEAAEQQH